MQCNRGDLPIRPLDPPRQPSRVGGRICDLFETRRMGREYR